MTTSASPAGRPLEVLAPGPRKILEMTDMIANPSIIGPWLADGREFLQFMSGRRRSAPAG